MTVTPTQHSTPTPPHSTPAASNKGYIYPSGTTARRTAATRTTAPKEGEAPLIYSVYGFTCYVNSPGAPRDTSGTGIKILATSWDEAKEKLNAVIDADYPEPAVVNVHQGTELVTDIKGVDAPAAPPVEPPPTRSVVQPQPPPTRPVQPQPSTRP